MRYLSTSILLPVPGLQVLPRNGECLLKEYPVSPTSILCEPGQGTAERLKVKRGAPLFCAGDMAGGHVFAIVYGSFKCSRVDAQGEEQIFGFRLRGDVVALDTIGLDRHTYHVTALEDSAVCMIAVAGPHCALSMQRLISKEVAREQCAALVLRNNGAESRLAHFFLDLAERHQLCGLSGSRFRLSMERQEIASYLALSPASISRSLRKLQLAGLIDFIDRDITILSKPGLQLLVASGSIDSIEAEQASVQAPRRQCACVRQTGWRADI